MMLVYVFMVLALLCCVCFLPFSLNKCSTRHQNIGQILQTGLAMKRTMSKVEKRSKSNSIHLATEDVHAPLSGYCKKLSSKKKWQKRYFTATDHYLNYTSTKKSTKVLGKVQNLCSWDPNTFWNTY